MNRVDAYNLRTRQLRTGRPFDQPTDAGGDARFPSNVADFEATEKAVSNENRAHVKGLLHVGLDEPLSVTGSVDLLAMVDAIPLTYQVPESAVAVIKTISVLFSDPTGVLYGLGAWELLVNGAKLPNYDSDNLEDVGSLTENVDISGLVVQSGSIIQIVVAGAAAVLVPLTVMARITGRVIKPASPVNVSL